MTLSSGTRLGPYELVAPVGAGGMGEVYRAKDTRLDRTVAVKVLPAHLSSSAESRQRFEREARTISRLRWLACQSDESGQAEVYVRRFPSGPAQRISSSGGGMPIWRRDGKELFLHSREGMLMSVAIREVGSRLEIGPLAPLFELRLSDALLPFRRKYDVFPDGERFLVIRRAAESDPDTVAVALNWTGMLKKKP